jgi:hypothetical protein
MGAAPEPSEEREDGPIAQCRGRGTRIESENLLHLVSRYAVRHRGMAPLAGGESSRFQARRQGATEHQAAEHGSDGGPGKPSPPAVFVDRFLPDKVRDLLRVSG